MSQLEDLLQQCTVKLTLPDRMGWGTGFFVAPEWILTCAHVVQTAQGQPVQVQWQKQELEAVVERSLPDPYDLALLRVTLPIDTNPPCVYLDAEIGSRDPLCLFGYPDEGDQQGEPRTFNCDGLTGSEVTSILFNRGEVRPGMSGSPLLNQRTGKVCGIVKFTRDRSSDLGGGAISTRVVLEQFPELRGLQQEFHQGDRRWSDLVLKRSDAEVINQTNLDGTNYQTQTVDGTNYFGGVHLHHSDPSQEKQTVKKILMLSANPENPVTSRRRKEIREIKSALSRAKHKDFFNLEDRSHIEAANVLEELVDLEPYV
ncbi:MAG: trypsin-like peptidase domain-containing protein, partial [Leptolyngbyaceae cyanobacterium CRU_2_3]|nr:trypsin-like peptidase domain-containing protein [Leptolyngbyaceae cyanobacterium CRU_2_3]